MLQATVTNLCLTAFGGHFHFWFLHIVQFEMMKNSTDFRNSEHGFDPKLDFSQFLEEARKNRASVVQVQVQPKASLQQQIEAEKKMPSDEEKSKKSWKKSLFSWLKVEKKSKSSRGLTSVSPHTPNLRPGSISGPIYGSGRKIVPSHQVRRPASGPIADFFATTGGEELMIPYISLDQLNQPENVSQSYGPVYLVT